jgi:hypothetical protein
MITKRQKITISSLLIAAGLFSIPMINPAFRTYALLTVAAASYILSIWSIYASFSGLELISLFVLPVILTTSFALYINQFQTTVGLRLILAIVYVAVMYTILLSENIFNVSLERNIPLVRAARTIGYIATLFVSFAFFTLLFGLQINVFLFALIAFLISSLLFAQGLWQIELKETNLRWAIIASVVSGFIVGQVALTLGFWPLTPPKMGLALTAAIYLLLGILQHYMREDLTARTAFEYIFVGTALVALLIVSTSWGV